MNKTVAILIGGVLLAILVLFNTTYSIWFHEIGVRTRFGEILGVQREPGLHWKAPFFIDRIGKLDTRLQLLNSSEDAVSTRDTQQVIVQAFVLWQLNLDDEAGIQEYFKQYGTIASGAQQLQGQLQSSLRSGIGRFNFEQLVGEGGNLKLAEDAILQELQATRMPGIRIATVGITQLVLPAKTTVAVLRRMEAEQRRRADAERAAGSARAEAVRNQAIADADKIRAFAQDRASMIRAQGDSEASQFYKTMKEGESLATFLAWLRAFESSLGNNTTIILDTTREPWHLIDAVTPIGPDGIPLPRNSWEKSMPGPSRLRGDQPTADQTPEPGLSGAVPQETERD